MFGGSPRRSDSNIFSDHEITSLNWRFKHPQFKTPSGMHCGMHCGMHPYCLNHPELFREHEEKSVRIDSQLFKLWTLEAQQPTGTLEAQQPTGRIRGLFHGFNHQRLHPSALFHHLAQGQGCPRTSDHAVHDATNWLISLEKLGTQMDTELVLLRSAILWAACDLHHLQSTIQR